MLFHVRMWVHLDAVTSTPLVYCHCNHVGNVNSEWTGLSLLVQIMAPDDFVSALLG